MTLPRTAGAGCRPATPGFDDLVADAAGLTLALLGGGVSAARRIIESLAWGRPCRCGSACGSVCGSVVRHYYQYECIPPCYGGPCG